MFTYKISQWKCREFDTSLTFNSSMQSRLLTTLENRLVEWYFKPLSRVFKSYHCDSSHYTCLSWVLPGWGSEVSCPRTLPEDPVQTLEKKTFENIVGKGENACNQHFLLFPQCFFYLSQNRFQFFSHKRYGHIVYKKEYKKEKFCRVLWLQSILLTTFKKHTCFCTTSQNSSRTRGTISS